MFDKRKPIVGVEKEDGETDLSFVADLVPMRESNIWTIERFKLLLSLLKSGITREEIAKKLELCSAGYISALLRELRIAGEKGYSLEAYLKAGRPFSPGKRVVKS